MTVRELMEFLEKYPEDLRVVVNGELKNKLFSLWCPITL